MYETRVEMMILGRVYLMLRGKPDNWALADADNERLKAIATTAQIMGIKTLYAPVPSEFNARIVTPEELTEKRYEYNGVSIMRGCNADGVVIPPGDGFYLASADCPTIIAVDPKSGLTIAAHAGRDCLMDRGRIATGKRSRPHESVVDAMIDRFKASGSDLARLKVYVTCGVWPEWFGHDMLDPVHGPDNLAMCRDIVAKWGATCLHGDITAGKISLQAIIVSQFAAHGVRHVGADLADTYDDRNKEGDHMWWSHARGDGDARNGVFVMRRY